MFGLILGSLGCVWFVFDLVGSLCLCVWCVISCIMVLVDCIVNSVVLAFLLFYVVVILA